MQTFCRSKVIGLIFNQYCSGFNRVFKVSQTEKVNAFALVLSGETLANIAVL